MNLTWELFQRHDHKWAVLLPNGSFDGMLGSVENGDADMTAASLSITAGRQKKFNFLVCLMSVLELAHILLPAIITTFQLFCSFQPPKLLLAA